MRIATGLYLLLLTLLLPGGCTSGLTFDSSQVDRSLTPAVVTAESHNATGRQVLWGGMILGTTNLPDSTLIEMLAYPLDSRDKPQRDKAAQGRFFLEQGGFLDPAVYAAGRLLTVSGTILRIETGREGEAEQTYPVISVKELHLWPRDSRGEDPSIFFGIGAGFDF
jgi:outer membrane lipoprotein